MIDRVERFVLNNRRIKVAKLASECGISNGSVYTLIHEHLGMSKKVESSQELLEVYIANPEDFHTRLVQKMKIGFTTGTQILKKSPCNGSTLAHPNLRNFLPNHQPAR